MAIGVIHIAALGLNEDLFPHIRIHVKRISKQLLAAPTAVAIRMIEEISAVFQSRLQKMLSPFCIQPHNPHTPNRYGGHHYT